MKLTSYIFFFLGIAGFFYGYETGNLFIQTISKPIPVIVLILSIKQKNPYSKLIMLGLILSLIGDVLLAKIFDKFLFGLISFLLAQVVYIFAFLRKSKRLALAESIPFYAYGAILFFFLQTYIPQEMKIPVAAYTAVITTMLWRSFVQNKSGKYASYAFYGALLFVISDTFIAISRFYQVFNYYREAIILTYWAAQYLIFLSANSRKTIS